MVQALQKPVNIREQVPDEEWQVRVDLAAAYRLVDHYGWTDMIFTHLSARVPGPEQHFLINPYGMMFDEVSASNLVKIDFEGNIVLSTGYDINPAGFCIHSAIHMSRDDAHAVMHLHTDDGVAVSAMAAGLLPVTQTAMIIHDQIAYHEYEGIALDLGERERLAADLGDKQAMILRNHGTLAVGKTVSGCFLTLYILERACSMQVRAMAGGSLHQPSAESIKTSREQGRMLMASGERDQLAWPALLRMLDRKDAGFRQ
ncbi:MAG: class II aldolase/adducin family protein [Gammaproteobacteria bacterium]|nr:class II aldolase/adducin family protein [Gammaproteobacteria bacterium]